MNKFRRPRKKLQRQGARSLRSEAYLFVGRNKPAPAEAGEGGSATQHMDFIRGRQQRYSLLFVNNACKECLVIAIVSYLPNFFFLETSAGKSS